MYTILQTPAFTIHPGQVLDIPIVQIGSEEVGGVISFPLPHNVPAQVMWNAFVLVDIHEGNETYHVILRVTNTDRVHEISLPETAWAFKFLPLLEEGIVNEDFFKQVMEKAVFDEQFADQIKGILSPVVSEEIPVIPAPPSVPSEPTALDDGLVIHFPEDREPESPLTNIEEENETKDEVIN